MSAWRSEEREYDVAVWKKRRNLFSVNAPMTDHFGLQFLKANVPGIHILEYPTPEEYRRVLSRGWDLVGISFYINERDDAILMAAEARRHGVQEVWGGNYGAYDPQVAGVFDKIVTGWGEEAVAEAMGVELRGIVHPPIYMTVRYQGFQVQRWGVLFTSRGCNKTCRFCQTPRFYRGPYELDTASLDRVLREYKRVGVAQVIILDENFGHFQEHTREVTRLLHQHGLQWNPLTRVQTLYEQYDEWLGSGLAGASLGIESLNQASLDGARKGNDAAQTRQVLSRMDRDGLLIQAFYIIGFPEDDEQSIRADIRELREFAIDSPQIQILTPYPNTKLAASVDREFGIWDLDCSHYDSTHLVWNHPNVSPDRMRTLLQWANDELFTPTRSLRTLSKIVRASARSFRRGRLRAPAWAGNIERHG